MHYDKQDKRLDEWVEARHLQLVETSVNGLDARKVHPSDLDPSDDESVKGDPAPSVPPADTQGADRVDKVMFGQWLIKTWRVFLNTNITASLLTLRLGTHRHIHWSLSRPRNLSRLISPRMSQRCRMKSTDTRRPMCYGCAIDASNTCREKLTSRTKYASFPIQLSSLTWSLQQVCSLTCPPGKEVYRHGAVSIYEVDGAIQKATIFSSSCSDSPLTRSFLGLLPKLITIL